MKRIPEEIKNTILQKATLHNVLQEYHSLTRKSGSSYKLDCPKCGTKNKLEYNEPKQVAKCFKCDIGVKSPVNYLTKYQNMSYPQALEELARIENVDINLKVHKKERQKNHQVPYIQTFLDGSGLNTADVTGPVFVDEETIKESATYTQGTVDAKFNIVKGDDVIIHYYDLDGRPMQYYKKDKKGNPVGNKLNFYRVRYQNPELHRDKDDNPVKYRSPYGSGTKVYINKYIREKYKKSSKIETLYIQEGEKKADKATKHGLISVGIMGIHNLAYNKRLPIEFEAIIKRCQVENVVFVLDSDWQDLSSKIDSKRSADQRPRSFFRAVLNFRDHFYAFTNNDIHLSIYFGHVKENPENDKGVDDLLRNSLRGKEDELKPLCQKALKEVDADSKWLKFYKITTVSEYKLMEYWHLQNIESFTGHYYDKLKDLPKFKFGSIEWRYNDAGKLELAQPLMPIEQFWKEDIKRNDNGDIVSKKVSFNHKRCYTFLRNRGYYRLSQPNNTFIWVHLDGSLVQRVEPFQIKDFVVEFAEQLNKEDVENMLYRGGKQYLGPDSLGNIRYTELKLNEPSKNTQYLYFNNNYMKVTDEGIEFIEMKNLNGQVWTDNIIDFEPSKTEPLINELHQINDNDIKDNPDLKQFKDEYTINFSKDGERCHFLKFLLNTSIFFGKEKSLEQATLEETFETTRHLLSKITAFGYMLHRYRNPSCERAVVGMDGTMTEVGNSNGRSGKSLFGVAIEQLIPTVTIPGKKRDLLDDKFLFEEVDQRTAAIFFDDLRVNFDFEFLFPFITGKFTLEKKGLGKMTLPRDYVQKFYLSTNHALNGDGGSFEDRQFMLGFSNWYNSKHKPVDDFGVMFFDEWERDQWNLFYNFSAMALHLYFKHGLIAAPAEKMKNRKLRQQIGEQFLDWAEEYFSNRHNVNCQIYKDAMYQCVRGDSDHIMHGDGFVTKYPSQRRFTNIQKFKSKIQLYCEYKGYDYNPTKKGGDIKKGGKEYLAVYIPEEEYNELLKDMPVESEEVEPEIPY